MGWSHRPTGLTHYQPSSAYRGYTLFSANGGNDGYLIDMEGDIRLLNSSRGTTVPWRPQLPEE